jgi:hypothetical protein
VPDLEQIEKKINDLVQARADRDVAIATLRANLDGNIKFTGRLEYRLDTIETIVNKMRSTTDVSTKQHQIWERIFWIGVTTVISLLIWFGKGLP